MWRANDDIICARAHTFRVGRWVLRCIAVITIHITYPPPATAKVNTTRALLWFVYKEAPAEISFIYHGSENGMFIAYASSGLYPEIGARFMPSFNHTCDELGPSVCPSYSIRSGQVCLWDGVKASVGAGG